jgi:hypothetical protein
MKRVGLGLMLVAKSVSMKIPSSCCDDETEEDATVCVAAKRILF